VAKRLLTLMPQVQPPPPGPKRRVRKVAGGQIAAARKGFWLVNLGPDDPERKTTLAAWVFEGVGRKVGIRRALRSSAVMKRS